MNPATVQLITALIPVALEGVTVLADLLGRLRDSKDGDLTDADIAAIQDRTDQADMRLREAIRQARAQI